MCGPAARSGLCPRSSALALRASLMPPFCCGYPCRRGLGAQPPGAGASPPPRLGSGRRQHLVVESHWEKKGKQADTPDKLQSFRSCKNAAAKHSKKSGSERGGAGGGPRKVDPCGGRGERQVWGGSPARDLLRRRRASTLRSSRCAGEEELSRTAERKKPESQRLSGWLTPPPQAPGQPPRPGWEAPLGAACARARPGVLWIP